MGCVYRPTYVDRYGIKRTSSIWWITYYVNGKQHYESSKTKDHKLAKKLLKIQTAKAILNSQGLPIDMGEVINKKYLDCQCPQGSGVYVIGTNNWQFKIGKAINLKNRLKELFAVIPTPIKLIYFFQPTPPITVDYLEKFLHYHFDNKKMEGTKEIFNLTINDINHIPVLCQVEALKEYEDDVQFEKQFEGDLKLRCTEEITKEMWDLYNELSSGRNEGIIQND